MGGARDIFAKLIRAAARRRKKRRAVLARASDLHTMLKLLKTVPIDSVLYHSSRNHFSKWLFARTEFETAYHIRLETPLDIRIDGTSGKGVIAHA